MKKNLDYILSNFVFITRITVKISSEYLSDAVNVNFFPVVGILMGWISFLVFVVFQHIFSSATVAFLITMAMVFLTGGIHLDGLSDTADGLLSYRSPDRMIEIMKDSSIGAMGVLALILILLAKIFFVYELIEKVLIFFVLLFPIYGRLCIVNACFFGRPIDKSKLGRGFIGNMSVAEFLLIQTVCSVYNATILWHFSSMELLRTTLFASFGTQLLLILMSYLFVRKVTAKINGISGDVLGAVCEIGEAFSMSIFMMVMILCEKFI